MILPIAKESRRNQFTAMKTVRLFSKSVLLFILILCLITAGAMPAYAAEPDMKDYLAKALGVTAYELSNYASDYKASLPVEYEVNSKSHYVALGGLTATGTVVIPNYSTGYTDRIATKLGCDYTPGADGTLTSSGAVKHITNNASATRAIPKADLITFQIDGASFISSCVDGASSQADAPWETYITDASVLAELKSFRSRMTAEYSAEYGEKNAKSIAIVLEYMLYECVVYSHETIKAVQAIRTLNENAVVLVVGLYNPMHGLSFTANGKTLDMGNMIEEMITVCDAYLLKQTKNLKKVAFIDVSSTSTNGFGNVQLNVNNTDALNGQLNDIRTAIEKQYANQAGHDYICEQILDYSLRAPCKHTRTTAANKKTANCKEAGYTGDTVCADCGIVITKGSDIAKTNHSYGAWTQSKTPGCTEKGEEKRTCTTCSHAETRPVDAKGHSWDKGTVTKKPSCTEIGTKTITCATCKLTQTETVDKIPHAWDKGEITKEPSCTEEGSKTTTCTSCKKTETQTLDKLPHAWDAGVITKEPNCMEEGKKTVTCNSCKKSQTETLEKLPHDWDEGEITKEPDCKNDGETTFTCNSCSTTKTEVIPALPHTWGEITITKQPSCTEPGEKSSVCTACGDAVSEEIPVTAHSFGEYTPNKDATCEKDGTKTAVCESCGAKDTVTDPSTRLDHVYTDGTCAMCGANQSSNLHNDNTVRLIVGICAAVVVIGGSVLCFWLIKKNKLFK